VDDVIFPSETRNKIVMAFKMLEGKKEELPAKKYGNIPM